MKNILVIGGGASGMAAAYAAASDGNRVTLFEKNEKLGKKVYISGKGRCNITNASDLQEILAHVVSHPKFLYSALYGFTNSDLMTLMEKNGCPLKTERGNRVFPVSDHASDVIRTFENLMKKAGVRLCLNTEIREILTDAGRRRVTGVKTSDGEVIKADAVIVATGGLSYPATGSTGDGYRFADSLGISVTPTRPSLVPFTVSEPFIRELQGLSLRNVSIRVMNGKKTLYTDFGEMLFTHFGVSGPIILHASCYVSKQLEQNPLKLYIDLKPALTAEVLDERLQKDFRQNINRRFKNALDGLLPSKLIPVVVFLSGIDPEKKVNVITKSERQKLIDVIRNFELTLTKTRGYTEAIVTQGGIDVKEIEPGTMRSKKIAGLYFTGEVLDVDAMTGGYNLQICFSTGILAGRSVGKEKTMGFSVAIDGPAGAGKSTIAKKVAEDLSFIYVDTGAMYRAIGLYFLENRVDIHDETACTAALPGIDVRIAYEAGVQQVLLNGRNVSPLIRTQEAGDAASVVSVYPAVREKLLDLQRDMAVSNDVLMDGRDIGTVVLPNADLKVYLTASVEVRAKRRYLERIEKHEEADLQAIMTEISERDYRDMHRDISPLKQAEDAVVVDSSEMTISEVVAAIEKLIEARR